MMRYPIMPGMQKSSHPRRQGGRERQPSAGYASRALRVYRADLYECSIL